MSSSSSSSSIERLQWEISHRKFGEERTERRSGTSLTPWVNIADAVGALQASTAYQVCVRVSLSGGQKTPFDQCREVLTPPPDDVYAVTEIAVAARFHSFVHNSIN